jgi:hypothetical protein
MKEDGFLLSSDLSLKKFIKQRGHKKKVYNLSPSFESGSFIDLPRRSNLSGP